MEEAAGVGVGIGEAHEMDEVNIYEGSKGGMVKGGEGVEGKWGMAKEGDRK